MLNQHSNFDVLKPVLMLNLLLLLRFHGQIFLRLQSIRILQQDKTSKIELDILNELEILPSLSRFARLRLQLGAIWSSDRSNQLSTRSNRKTKLGSALYLGRSRSCTAEHPTTRQIFQFAFRSFHFVGMNQLNLFVVEFRTKHTET